MVIYLVKQDHLVTTTIFLQGDSGGPLVLQDPLETLVGVVSTGYGCGDPHYPGIYSRVDAYLDWIDAQVFGYCSKSAFEYRNNAIIADQN